MRQIARYLPHHRSENASKTHPKSSHDKFKTASYYMYASPPFIPIGLSSSHALIIRKKFSTSRRII